MPPQPQSSPFTGISSPQSEASRKEAIIPIEKYRQLTGDYESDAQKVLERLAYFEEFSRVIIRNELETYVKKRK